MTEKRLDYDLLWNNYYQVIELDDEDTDYLRRLSPTEIIKMLNEQQATIRKLQDLCGESDSENAKLRIENKKLKAKLKEKEEDERLYANEIVELRKTNEEWLQFKDLGGDY